MTKMIVRLLSHVLDLLRRELQKLINGLSGKDRQDKRRLMQHLATLQANYNVMQRDIEEKQRSANLEIRGLAALKQAAEEARDDLQLQVWELEQQIEELLSFIASAHRPQPSKTLEVKAQPIPDPTSDVDLSSVNLGLVGGHPATRRGVIKELSNEYGLRYWVVIPPLREARIRKNKLKKKLGRCSLIVIIADYMSHPLTHAVFRLQASGAIAGEVVLLNCHGKTGVVREILKLVKRQIIEK